MSGFICRKLFCKKKNPLCSVRRLSISALSYIYFIGNLWYEYTFVSTGVVTNGISWQK